MNQKWIAANWKLNKTPHQVREYFEQFKSLLKVRKISSRLQLIFFPSAVCSESMDLSLVSLRHELSLKNFAWGIQNCYVKDQGAFTGENSAWISQQMGAKYVLLGHSERRTLFQESDQLLSQKIQYVLEVGLHAMFCVGESLSERDRGLTQSVLQEQISKGFQKLIESHSFEKAQDKIILAYEPIWAIGTGRVASPQQVQEAHQWIKNILEKLNMKKVPILYGGSVKPESARELISLPTVDGFLVGGASLEPESFLQICENANAEI